MTASVDANAFIIEMGVAARYFESVAMETVAEVADAAV